MNFFQGIIIFYITWVIQESLEIKKCKMKMKKLKQVKLWKFQLDLHK
jgi:hypothetical protein